MNGCIMNSLLSPTASCFLRSFIRTLPGPLGRAAFLLLLLLLTVSWAEAATVTRGPYLQMGTANSIVVRWRTDVATDSRVRYGLATTSLGSVAGSATVTTEHEISVSGL